MARPDETSANTLGKLPTEAAYEAIFAEISALPDEEIAPLNIDVVAAVTTVLGVLPGLRALRPEIQEELPRFDLRRFDKLEQYALALNHANALHRGALVPSGSIAQLGNELAGIRDRVLADAVSLANHGLIDGERLKEVRTAVGYRPVATDVFTLVALFKEHWASVENKTPVTLAQLHDAGNRAVELLAAVGLKDQAPVTASEAAQTRQKAFTLFVRAYDDARRAVAYLRPDDDGDEIAPSLYAGRGGRRRSDVAPTTATAAQASGTGTTTSSATTNGSAPAIEVDNSAGLPIDNPFTN
jgi:hypothetical protein